MFLKMFGCAYAIVVAAGSVYAHGPQMQITANDGRIVTRSILNDDYEPLTTLKSVYVMEVLEYHGVWYARPESALNPPEHPTAPGQPKYYSGPGIAYGIDQTFAVNSSLSISFVTGLQAWNGSHFDDAGSTELQYYRSGSIGASGELVNPTASIITTDGESSADLVFPEVTLGYDETAHSTARLRFLGDGMTAAVGLGTKASEPSDGIYLASLVLSSDDPLVAASEPFYYVMYKGVSWSDVSAAIQTLGVPNSAMQVLGAPEPSALILMLLGTCGFLARRRMPT